jgi:hypothetical protein
MNWRTGSLKALVCVLLAGCNGAGEVAATESALTSDHASRHRDNPNPALFEPTARPFGVSMERWSEEWWRWAYSMPMATNPNMVATADCGVGQDGPIFFLPLLFNATSDTNMRACKVPAHKPIAFPLVTLLLDYPCPDLTFKPAPGQTLFDFLESDALKIQTGFVGTIAGSIDGKPLNDLLSYHIVSDDLFDFSGDVSLQSIDNCVTGKRQPGVSASYFIVLKGLERGQHVVSASVAHPNGQSGGTQTFTLDVVGRD